MAFVEYGFAWGLKFALPPSEAGLLEPFFFKALFVGGQVQFKVVSRPAKFLGNFDVRPFGVDHFSADRLFFLGRGDLCPNRLQRFCASR